MPKQVYVISVPLIPRDAQAAVELRAALEVLCDADPTLGMEIGAANEITLKGQSEMQLEIALHQARQSCEAELEIGSPQIAYRESITKMVAWFHIYEKPGNPPQHAKVKIRLEPGKRGSGVTYGRELAGKAVPDNFVAAAEKGLARAMESGVIAGFPVTDLTCTLLECDHRDEDWDETAFEIAAQACFREAMPKAGPRLLEPMMKVAVTTPPDHMGDVIGDLNSRRGAVQDMDAHGNAYAITAMVPLANMFGYWGTLMSMTQGRAQFTMQYDHYEPMPPPPRRGGDDDFPMAAALRW